MIPSEKAFLDLVRLGIGHRTDALSENVDWTAMKALAEQQGLSAIILDGIEQLPECQQPPQLMLLTWIGQVMQGYEGHYEAYRKAVAELAAFYNAHGYKMMLLKGLASGRDWPNPAHRPYGDIDIWLFGKQKEADAALASLNHNDNHNHNFNGHKGKVFNEIKIDRSHHHHTVFNWNGFTVENHYDFVNVHAHKSSAELEKVFKELGREKNLNLNPNANVCSIKSQALAAKSLAGSHAEPGRTITTKNNDNHIKNHNDNANINSFGNHITCVDVCGERVYLPSANLHALFLMKHMAGHFAAVGITLRQVLDWAFFVEKHGKEVDWEWLDGMLVKYHMKDFFNCINAICVKDLGFEFNHNYLVNTNDTNFTNMKERVLEDILNQQFSSAEPSAFVPRMIYKYKRWQGNAWKQELCYKESRWSSFWSGIWAKILKPASI